MVEPVAFFMVLAAAVELEAELAVLTDVVMVVELVEVPAHLVPME